MNYLPTYSRAARFSKSIFDTVRVLYNRLRSVSWLFMLLALPFQTWSQDTTDNSTTDNTGSYSGAIQTVYPAWFKTSFLELEEDVAEAAEVGKRLMLLFHQDGCPYCNAFVERNLAQRDIEEHLRSNFDVVEINMWGDREVASVAGERYTEKSFAEALKVQFTPTVLFLTETGKLSLRINGYYNPDRFRMALKYVTGKMESRLTFAEFEKNSNPVKSSAELTTRPYFSAPASTIAQRKRDKPLILFFEQKSCQNCDMLHDDILSKPDSRALLENFDSYQIDMWGVKPIENLAGLATTGRQWSKQLGINYAPTLVLFAADGQEVIRSEAWFKSFHTQSILDYVVSDAWRTESNFQRYISARAEALQEKGTDVDIWD